MQNALVFINLRKGVYRLWKQLQGQRYGNCIDDISPVSFYQLEDQNLLSVGQASSGRLHEPNGREDKFLQQTYVISSLLLLDDQSPNLSAYSMSRVFFPSHTIMDITDSPFQMNSDLFQILPVVVTAVAKIPIASLFQSLYCTTSSHQLNRQILIAPKPTASS